MPLPPLLLLAEGTDGLVGGGGVGLGLAESGTVDTEMKDSERQKEKEREVGEGRIKLILAHAIMKVNRKSAFRGEAYERDREG